MIQSIEIENFKSIRNQRVELGNLNILIGPNGAGKSNFISLFRFLERMGEGLLEEYIFNSGGFNNFLFKGYEISKSLKVKIEIEDEGNKDSSVLIDTEISSDGENYSFSFFRFGIWNNNRNLPVWIARLPEYQEKEVLFKKIVANEPTDSWANYLINYTYSHLKTFKIYHFHDTSDNAQIKLPQDIEDVYHFKAEGENLAPFLLLLKEQHFETYLRIVETVRLVYPFFHDFVLEESPRAKGKVVLRWKEKGNGITYTARQVSDGTLRFICLATLLIQPAGTAYVPRTVILDEPELGLHPFAMHVLAELIQKAAREKQIIIATQSVSLINYFTPKDLLITERTPEGATEFRRLKDEDFAAWLDDYSLGQLWESNVFGGRP